MKDEEPNLLIPRFNEIPQHPPLHLFPFKNNPVWAESLELVFRHESTFSPDSWLFWIKQLYLLLTLASQITDLSGEQRNPSSLTKLCQALLTVFGTNTRGWDFSHLKTMSQSSVCVCVCVCVCARMWQLSRSVVSDSLRPPGTAACQALRSMGFLGQNTGVGCYFLL